MYFEEYGFFVVAEQAKAEVLGEVQTFLRIRAVADDVAQAYYVCDAAAADILQYDLEGLKVAVNVGNYRLHLAASGAAIAATWRKAL